MIAFQTLRRVDPIYFQIIIFKSQGHDFLKSSWGNVPPLNVASIHASVRFVIFRKITFFLVIVVFQSCVQIQENTFLALTSFIFIDIRSQKSANPSFHISWQLVNSDFVNLDDIV